MSRVRKSVGAPTPEALMTELLKLATLVNRPMRVEVAEAHSLTLDELKIISCLGGRGPMAGHDLAEVMVIAPMNVSRALVQLKARGWVEPAPDANDRRRKPVRLTAGGEQAFLDTRPRFSAVAEGLLRDVSERERAIFLKALYAINARIEAQD